MLGKIIPIMIPEDVRIIISKQMLKICVYEALQKISRLRKKSKSITPNLDAYESLIQDYILISNEFSIEKIR